MKYAYAGGDVIGKIVIDITFDDENLDMQLKTKAEVHETAAALQALGFSGEGGIEKTKIIAHEVAVGKHIEGGLGIDRGEVEKGAKSGNAANPQELKSVQEGKQIRPAAQVQEEVLAPTTEPTMTEYAPQSFDNEVEQEFMKGKS